MIRVAIGGRSKTLQSHLTTNPPEQTNKKYETWEQEDLIVFSWLIQNIEPVLAGNLNEYSTAKELWDALVTTYSSGKDKLQIFNLHVKANELKQSDKSLEDFLIALQGVWEEIDRNPNPMKCPEDIKTYAKIRSDQKLFQFLNGLDRKFEPIKREILRVDPLPTAEAAYATVRKEAAHQNILGATNNEPQGIATGLIAGETEGVGFVTKGYRRNDGKKKWVTKDDKSHLKCEECGMSRHTKEQCFRIVGYPDWWTDGNKKGTKSAKTEKEKVPTTNTSSINKENTSDGRRSDGGFGGLAAAGNKGVGGDFSDIKTGRIIRRDTEREGLHYVDEVTTSGTVMLAHVTSEREVWSDNGGECMNSQMNLFFQSKGIVHQTTCPHTPEQNGVAERKNRLLLEMTRALIIESYVPKTFWPEALATATYLINRLPTKILKMKTPLETLTEYHTLPQVLTLEPKVFGCTVFAHIPKSYHDKLDPCAEKCVFVGYGVNQNGYRCYNPKTRHMFTTMNCDFLETKYFYSPQHSGQGEEQCDTLSWLRYTSEESCPNQNTTSAGAQEQSSSNINATEDTIPNLISEVSTSQPSDYLDEILENIHETIGVQEHEEPTLIEVPKKYVLPARSNRGIPSKRYTPEKASRRQLKPVGCRWIFTIKYKPYGTVERYKARLVAKGYAQTYGIDYSEIFSPVAKIDTIRVLFSIAANQGWPLHQFDVKNAFLHGELKEEVYMEAPPGFSQDFKHGEVCKLKKSLYGLKQSPRARFGSHRGDRVTCLIIYVDDMIITENDESEIKKLKEGLCAEFEMKDLRNLRYFLRIEVMRSQQGIFICQKKYILDLLAETWMIDYIAYAVGVVSQFMHQPQVDHMHAVLRIVKYLKGTTGHGVLFKTNGPLNIQIFIDADWAGDKGNKRSTSGYFSLVGGNLVTWKSKKQKVVSLSSAEAEFRGIAKGLAEALWIRKLVSETGFPLKESIRIMSDNKAAIQISENPVQHDRTKHVEVGRHFIKEKLEAGIIKLPFVKSKDQLVDILTKAVGMVILHKCLNKLNFGDPTIQLEGEC
ncbi:putative RNA-directed DNA polymerase [Tanacetum coccineum]